MKENEVAALKEIVSVFQDKEGQDLEDAKTNWLKKWKPVFVYGTKETIKKMAQNGVKSDYLQVTPISDSNSNLILKRKVMSSGVPVWVPFISRKAGKQFLKAVHQGEDGHRHLGITAMENLVKVQFYWKGYVEDIQNFVNKCKECIRKKGSKVKF
jgi:hypothetical protein